jgi:hypothetical protein
MINEPVNVEVADHDDKSFNLRLPSPVFYWVQKSPKCEINISIIKKICPKNYYVDKWQLMVRLFSNCIRMVNNYKCYTPIKD